MPRTINDELVEQATRLAPKASSERDLAERLVRGPREVVRVGVIAALVVGLLEAYNLFGFLWALFGVVGLVVLGAFATVVLFRMLRGADERLGEEQEL